METIESKPSKIRLAIALNISAAYLLTLIVLFIIHELNQ